MRTTRQANLSNIFKSKTDSISWINQAVTTCLSEMDRGADASDQQSQTSALKQMGKPFETVESQRQDNQHLFNYAQISIFNS